MPPEPPADRAPSAQPSTEWLERANRQALAIRLLASAVHDVNNALQVVSGTAEVLAMDPSPAAVEKRTASIVAQAVRATAVLEVLSGFVKAPPTPRAEVDLKSVAQHALALRQDNMTKLRVDARVDGDSAACLGCPRGLLQVVLNLFVNAERAIAAANTPALRLVAFTDGDYAVLDVIDNGCGVPEARRAQLCAWSPGELPDANALGLGLLVSQGILARDRGSLHYEPGEGGGSVFTIRVPRPAALGR